MRYRWCARAFRSREPAPARGFRPSGLHADKTARPRKTVPRALRCRCPRDEFETRRHISFQNHLSLAAWVPRLYLVATLPTLLACRVTVSAPRRVFHRHFDFCYGIITMFIGVSPPLNRKLKYCISTPNAKLVGVRLATQVRRRFGRIGRSARASTIDFGTLASATRPELRSAGPVQRCQPETAGRAEHFIHTFVIIIYLQQHRSGRRVPPPFLLTDRFTRVVFVKFADKRTCMIALAVFLLWISLRSGGYSVGSRDDNHRSA